MIIRGLVFRVFYSRSLKTINSASFQVSHLFKDCNECWRDCKWLHTSSINCKIKISKEPVAKETVKTWINITVQQLADILETSSSEIISLIPKELIKDKIEPNTKLESLNLIKNVVKKYGRKCNFVSHSDFKKSTFAEKQEKILKRQPPPKPENLKRRPPVVTVMGHVDHGKTTLLDSLRNTFVVKEEFGGITQHIGAFLVEVQPGKKITFIDTPGHAAFTSMRARGAQVTDIVVLVIAADDGIMEQTVESIKIAKRAAVPMIVAVNKIDKPNASKLDDIKQKLIQEGLQVEDFGGKTQLVPISALKKINLDLLTNTILLEAENMNLRGDPTGLVEGVVIESKITENGRLATILIKRGTLKKGSILVAGKAHAKVRIMLNENGKEYKEALPSTPVQILGWKELPAAGDEVIEAPNQKTAQKIIKLREQEELAEKELNELKIIQEKAVIHQEEHRKEREIFAQMDYRERRKFYFQEKLKQQALTKLKEEEKVPTLNLILKGDVNGTLEVLKQVLSSYKQHDECVMSIVAASVGSITIKDIEIAEIFNANSLPGATSKDKDKATDDARSRKSGETFAWAIIYGFNVDYHSSSKDLALSKNIDVRFYNVIYRLIDDLKAELELRIPPVDVEEIQGEAEVLQNFFVSVKNKKKPVAGSKCTSGLLKKNALFKIKRNSEVIFEGKLLSLKHFKSEVNSVKKDTQCGLMFDSFSGEFKPGDQIICYELVKTSKKTSWNPGF